MVGPTDSIAFRCPQHELLFESTVLKQEAEQRTTNMSGASTC
jgi:hypothetical protein